ncbi:hypothetical protein R1sor_007202 [Riccia sorocarpa]|uniref:Uncharacterized protein n=1 Tax=Riccia sorocarpa TaxID=122646 RepID=A0ABD3HTY3_9MARC
MWEFLELCHNYNVDLTQLEKVAQALIFKKHSDKKFDFADYMQKKGLKITLPSTENTPLELGGTATSTSGEGSKKLKGKVDVLVKKLKVVGAVPPKKPATGTVRIGPTPDGSKPATGTVHAPKLRIGPTPDGSKQKTGTPVQRESSKKKLGTPGITLELQASKLTSGTSADTTSKKPRAVKIIPQTQTLPSVVEYNSESCDEDSTKTKKRKAVAVLQKKTGFQPERHVVETDQEAKDVKMQLDPKTKD